MINTVLNQDLIMLANEYFEEKMPRDVFKEYKVVGARNFSTTEISYAEALKRKYGNDDAQQGYQNQSTSNSPPDKLHKKNLYYSKFSKPSAIQLNTQDPEPQQAKRVYHRDPHFEKIMDRLAKLEESGNNSDVSTLSQEEWSKSMETKITKRMEQMEKRFQKKIDDNEEYTTQMIGASEDRMIEKFNQSLEQKLDVKLDGFLGNIQKLITPGSTTAMPSEKHGIGGKYQ